MPFVHENVKVELFPGTPSPIVYLSENDVGDTVAFELVYKGQPVNIPDGSVVKFKGTKKNGLGFTVDSSDISDNVVEFIVSEDMTSCSGVVESEISITLSNNKHGTCNVVLIVEKNPHLDGTQDGSYPQIVSEMRQLVEQIEGDAETASNAADVAVAAKNSALEIQQDVHQYTADAIDDWLDNHPEATTTVQDGAITEVKFSDALKLKTIKDYVTPEMFGAKGDGATDDSIAFTNMFSYIKSVKVPGTRNSCPSIVLSKVYNIGIFTVPNNYYHDLMFIGGVIIGEMTFPQNSFYTIQFYGTTFRNSDGFAIILNPNREVEYKMCSFKSCRFMSKNGVKTDTRSILLLFDTCTFHGCDYAYYGGDTDKLIFKNCWFDTKPNKSESDTPYTIYIYGENESACVVDSCIVVNATINIGMYEHTSFVGTMGEACFTNTRISNEASTEFFAVEFLENTLEKLSTNHVTGGVFNGCDVGSRIVYLLGIPSLISITGCMGNTTSGQLIKIDPNLTDVYKIRPALRIIIKDNAFGSFNVVKKYGNSMNAIGVNVASSLIPTIPFVLYYAVNKNYQGQNDPLVVPLTNGYKYSVAINTTIDLFKIVRKGTIYNDLYINGKVFFVKYSAQIPNTNNIKQVVDVVTLNVSSNVVTLEKTNLFNGNGTVNYLLSVDDDAKEYTVSMLSTDRLLSGIDYGLFDNGFATI